MASDYEFSVKTESGNSFYLDSKRWFVASENPFYVGVIMLPGPNIWADMSASKTVEGKFRNESRKFVVKQRIEVGENSIFFLKLEDKPFSEAED